MWKRLKYLICGYLVDLFEKKKEILDFIMKPLNKTTLYVLAT